MTDATQQEPASQESRERYLAEGHCLLQKLPQKRRREGAQNWGTEQSGNVGDTQAI